MRLYKEESDSLKEIVDSVFSVDIFSDNRRRNVIDARHVYSKILREKGYSYESIGSSIKKNHATIIHYVKNIDSILKYDKSLSERYFTCKLLFSKDRESILNELNEGMEKMGITPIDKQSELSKEDIEKYFAEKQASEKRVRESLQGMSASQRKRATKYFPNLDKLHYAK